MTVNVTGSQIKKVIYDEKDDTCNSESHAEEKVNSSDVDPSDDKILPLSKLKMISCQRQDIGQIRNPITMVSDAYSTLEEIKSNGEGDSTNIDQIIERLQDTEDREIVCAVYALRFALPYELDVVWLFFSLILMGLRKKWIVAFWIIICPFSTQKCQCSAASLASV